MSLDWYRNVFGEEYRPLDKSLNNPMHGGYINGLFYAMSATVSAAAVAANVCYATPFIVYRQQLFDALSCNVTVGSAGSGLLGIASNRSGRPDKLIAQSATFDTSTVTGKTGLITPITLIPSVYWLLMFTNGTATYTSVANNQSYPQLCGSQNLPTNIGGYRFNSGLTYPTLPDSFYELTLTGSFVTPQLAIRAA